jgi:16S rRNA C967 or C1407 C5-methylase (RsmB/RsmF family)
MELPKQFIQSIQQVKGFNEEAFIQVHTTEQQVTSIRINPEKKNIVQHLPIESALPWCNNGYYLTHRPSFTLDPLFHAGTYYVQEASSMFLWKIMQQIFPSNTAKKVLDVCAAPGGKSTLLSSYFSNGLVVSNEVIKPRAAVLVENICKWGTNNVVVTNNDPKDFAALKGFFDAIVVDAPM